MVRGLVVCLLYKRFVLLHFWTYRMLGQIFVSIGLFFISVFYFFKDWMHYKGMLRN